MAAVQITGITRVNGDANNYDIRQGFGAAETFTVRNDDAIFNTADAVPAPPTEAARPAAFLFAAANIPLTVNGTYGFPVGLAAYRLRGDGPGGFQITSQNFNATGVAGGAAVPFTATVFSHAGPQPASPFKVAGDWTWTILPAAGGGGIATSAGTRLEVYFMLGDHDVPFPFAATQILELIRLSFPTYGTIAGQPWANIEGPLIWEITQRLWLLGRPGLFYDSTFATGGAAQHLLGTNFNLETMVSTVGVRTCNCYDLASLVKLALGSLGKKPDPANNGAEIPVISNVRIVADEPWGYIPSGPLFGWSGSLAHQCNNPFWINRGGPGVHAAPQVPQMDPQRTAFRAHCYTTFTDHAGVVRPIDVCHAVINPAGGLNLTGGAVDVPTYQGGSIQAGPVAYGPPVPQNVVVNWVQL
ncbi:hypothetical protein B0T26DRAFT_752477 [Lasiosphaeria miniovina]|uniref:Uncharacterized protein n=1 Tax=Lasiosphaeria miniovina TaxID=1954250 RepID=A0AA40DZE7_9PEZI|nr:uncharacterized protein B0T26DRAFT_752477 [Lasiosphaeria miniovina]KAK0718566.1 hypothetical protein B0T26DRAFT_752477 [Lasiosphaeria miniovina]